MEQWSSNCKPLWPCYRVGLKSLNYVRASKELQRPRSNPGENCSKSQAVCLASQWEHRRRRWPQPVMPPTHPPTERHSWRGYRTSCESPTRAKDRARTRQFAIRDAAHCTTTALFLMSIEVKLKYAFSFLSTEIITIRYIAGVQQGGKSRHSIQVK